MKSFLFREAIPALVLMSFLTIVFFSFVFMTYGQDGRMQSDCLFSVVGTAPCSPGETGAIHHISAYQSFLNVPVGSDLTTAIIASLLALAAALVFSALPLLVQPLISVAYFFDPPPVSFGTRKITHWLSLFENSPSLT